MPEPRTRTPSNKGRAASGEQREQVSEVAELLADQRRRYALYALVKYRTPMALADLADEVVRREMNARPTDVPDARYPVYAQLYHKHLPKLADADVVCFDHDENLVELGPRAEDLISYFDSDDFDEGADWLRDD